MGEAIYADRLEAGKALARAIKRELSVSPAAGKPLVLAIPRGGVVIGMVVAQALGAELDLVVPRKLGAEHQPEFAIGAVMQDGIMFLNQDSVRMTGASSEYIEAEKGRQMLEAKRRVAAYRGSRPEPKIAGRTVIVVDDGVATGATMVAALRWVRSKRAKTVVAATPLAPASTLAELREEADQVVCPSIPEPFYAIGAFYEKFEQVTDEEVKEILREGWAKE